MRKGTGHPGTRLSVHSCMCMGYLIELVSSSKLPGAVVSHTLMVVNSLMRSQQMVHRLFVNFDPL